MQTFKFRYSTLHILLDVAVVFVNFTGRYRFHEPVKGILYGIIMSQPAQWLNTSHVPDMVNVCICVLYRWDHAVEQRSSLCCWHRPGAQEEVRLPLRWRLASSVFYVWVFVFLSFSAVYISFISHIWHLSSQTVDNNAQTLIIIIVVVITIIMIILMTNYNIELYILSTVWLMFP